MKLLNIIRQNWDNFLSTIRSKRFLFTAVGFILVVCTIYLIGYTFTEISIQTRSIIGIAMQLTAGAILILDQVFSKKEFKLENIWEWLSLKRARVSMLIGLALFLILTFVWVAIGGEQKITFEIIIGVLIWLMLVFSVYLYSIQLVVKILEKKVKNRQKAGIESNIKLVNGIFFIISLIIVLLTGFFFRMESWQFNFIQFLSLLWSFIFAFFILPIFILSLVFWLILLTSLLFNFLREKIKSRTAFWMCTFALWLWGGLLLLVNALS